jgi:hypothetical protein
MSRHVVLRLIGVFGIFGALMCASPAQAALGGSVDSVVSDRAALPAVSLSTNTYSNYQVYEIQAGSTTIREYVSSSGIVFGIAWNGYTHPNLSQLLGTYLGDYQTASSQTPRERGRRPRLVQGVHVVVKTWGHMRNLQGHAYDPSLFPSGVSTNDIN